MGARQSKRSVDISSTPKKEAAEGGQPAEKLEKIEEGDVKVQNGHAEPVTQEGGEEVKTEAGSEKAVEPATPAVNGEGATSEQSGESGATSPAGDEKKPESTPASPESEAAKETPKSEEKAEKKKKEKSKKKWSFRSISFSKKDKTKPSMSKDDSKSNDLAKEAPVPEEGAAAKSEETSPSEPEATSPATEEPAKETKEVEKKEESEPAPAIDVKSVLSSVTSAAESGVQQVVEETTKIITEAKEAVNKIVETASKTVIEEIKSTTVTESACILKTSSKTIEIVEESLAPPLPASPPPTEAPPPTPVAPQPIQQHEHEEMNGGGEGMAEMPEENGLCENEKLDDEPEHDSPKLNGHNESPIVQKVEEITECLLKTSLEDKVVIDNHLEVAVGNENKE